MSFESLLLNSMSYCVEYQLQFLCIVLLFFLNVLVPLLILGFRTICEKQHAHLRSEGTSEVRGARLEGMIQIVQTVCGDEASKARADGCKQSLSPPPDVYITLVQLNCFLYLCLFFLQTCTYNFNFFLLLVTGVYMLKMVMCCAQ